MKKFLILSLFCLPFIFTSCGPDGFLSPKPSQADTLPPITTEGLQTFGYKVNGEVVTHDNQSARYINLDHQPENGLLYVQLNSVKSECTIKHDNIRGSGNYTFDISKRDENGLSLQGAAHCFKTADKSSFYILSQGEITILRYMIDTELPEYIISGTFWFEAVNEEDHTDTIHITEGRFDLNKK